MTKNCASIWLLLGVLIICCTVFSRGTQESTAHGAHGHKSAHLKGGVHNSVFDQEALLGSRNVDDLADLSQDVRIRRLKNLARSHDANNNDIIESNELMEWILQSFKMLDSEESQEKFEEEDENKDGKVEFAEILYKQYGYSEEDLDKISKEDQEEEDTDVLQLISDDKKRFEAADLNKDGALDDVEYMAYFQPYDYPHMHEVEMEKTLKDLDKDKDGFVSIEEFVGDNMDEESKQAEMTNFQELDKDKDGKLTPEELRPWAMPDNKEVAAEEVEHLVNMCDENQDGHLSIAEIVQKEDEFLSSAATDYGRNLHFVRDEL